MARGTLSGAALLLMAIVIGETVALHRKFPLYHAGRSRIAPVYLRHVAGLNIGYVRGHHGAHFVRLPPGSPSHTRTVAAEQVEIATAMQAELGRMPLKILGEISWYFAVIFGVICVPFRFACRRRKSGHVLAIIGAVAFFAGALLFQLPITLGYDGSVFSNWVGPGAYSYSRPHMGVTGIPGVTVSYRPFLEAMIAPPAKLVFALMRPDQEVSFWPFSLAVAFIYSLLGGLVGYLAAIIGRFRQSPAG